MKTLARRSEGVGGGGNGKGSTCRLRTLSLFYNRNLSSCILSLFSLTSSIVVPDLAKCLHVGVSVPTHVPFMSLPVHGMKPELNMISASTRATDYVVFNVIVDSGCFSHTFNCLNYIDNYKVMIEEDHSDQSPDQRERELWSLR